MDNNSYIYIYISVYSSFSDRVGLPLHNIPSSGVLMKNIGAEFYDLMHGMQYQIGLNIAFLSGTTTTPA